MDYRFCKNCGTKIDSNAKFCVNCGESIQSLNLNESKIKNEKRVSVYGYNEKFTINSSVTIYKNGMKIGEVKRQEKFDLGILTDDVLLEFKCSLRSTSIRLSAMHPQNVQLAFNRLTGNLEAYTTDEDYTIQNELIRKDGKNITISIIIILIVISLAILGIPRFF